jgi:hypothetical protein
LDLVLRAELEAARAEHAQGAAVAERRGSEAERLRGELEATRAELERLSTVEDADKALDILAELAELSRAVEVELQRAKRQAEADAGA